MMSRRPRSVLAPVLAPVLALVLALAGIGGVPAHPGGGLLAVDDRAEVPPGRERQGQGGDGGAEVGGGREGQGQGEDGRDERQGRRWEDEGRSHDRARQARESGEILTLAEIFARARREVPGRILEAELEREHGRWVYEVKILDPEGRLFELYLDAADGRMLEREEED